MFSIRRRQLLILAGGQLVFVLAARAQRRDGPRRVGFLSGTGEAFFSPLRASFETALRQLGWSPGHDVAILYRFSAGDDAAAHVALDELLAAQVELLVTAGAVPPATLGSKVPSLPIVALFDGDPVAQGLAVSMSRPGRNLTGVAALDTSQEIAKMMEILREAFPKMRRLGVLQQGHLGAFWREERAAAARLGIDLVLTNVASAEDIVPTLSSLARRKVDAVWVLFDPSWSIPEVARALRSARMPAISDVMEFAAAGGLMAYGQGVEMAAVFAQLARLVDKILRGASPGQIPIESTASPKLLINARTARELGYRPPPAILLRADRLIE